MKNEKSEAEIKCQKGELLLNATERKKRNMDSHSKFKVNEFNYVRNNCLSVVLSDGHFM